MPGVSACDLFSDYSNISDIATIKSVFFEVLRLFEAKQMMQGPRSPVRPEGRTGVPDLGMTAMDRRGPRPGERKTEQIPCPRSVRKAAGGDRPAYHTLLWEGQYTDKTRMVPVEVVYSQGLYTVRPSHSITE